jgi:hypothetical protein
MGSVLLFPKQPDLGRSKVFGKVSPLSVEKVLPYVSDPLQAKLSTALQSARKGQVILSLEERLQVLSEGYRLTPAE